MIPYFLKKEENTVKFNLDDKELIFFIPAIYFDRKYAEVINGNISIMGVFSYCLRDIKTCKDSELYNFNFPTIFETSPSDKVTIREYEHDGLVKDDYVLLKYRKGDTVIVSTKVIEDVESAETFFKMFTAGRLPSTIPYNKLHEYFLENISLAGKNYGINAQLFGIIIGEMAVQQDDDRKLFRHLKDMPDMHAYKLKNIKMSPKYVSPYSSYTSEVYDEGLINASLISKKSGTSPMEKLFMGY